MKKELIMTTGLPRSGKSTWAKLYKESSPEVAIVCPDEIRLAMYGQRFIPSMEDYVWAVAKTMVKALFQTGQQVIILDATNMTPAYRSKFFGLGEDTRTLAVFYTRKEVCLERAYRSCQNDLGPIIEKMSSKLDDILDKSEKQFDQVWDVCNENGNLNGLE